MSISSHDRKILWGLSGNRCAFPGCNHELYETIGENGNSLVGEECHIEAQNKGGPRYNVELNEAQIDNYNNLILLCPIHHKIIDDNPNDFSVRALKEMKAEHEAKVRLALDDKSINDILQYGAIISYLETMLAFDCWDGWTSYLYSPQPQIHKTIADSMEEIHRYIIGRIWSQRFPQLEESIRNLDCVLEDLIQVFHRHSEPYGDSSYRTVKFYKTVPYDHRIANKLLPEYHRHVFLINGLAEELTRALNNVCDMVRKYIDDEYRISDGKMMLDGKCLEYKGENKYPGLVELEERALKEYPD